VFVRTGIEGALKAARNATTKDVWIVGGAATMQAALELGEVDSIELFVVPTLLGSGLPLLSELDQPIGMALEGIETYQDGVVKLGYRPLNRRR
jgi:dihydrofolate reductase